MRTFVLMSEGYPVKVSNDYKNLFKDFYPKVKCIKHKGRTNSLEEELSVTNFVKVDVVFEATESFKENTIEYSIHRVKTA